MPDALTEGTADVNGAQLVFDPTGAAFWPEAKLLVVSDLHFEKGSSFAVKGQLIPPYDTRETLSLLEGAIARHSPEMVVCLGDSFHDLQAADRLTEDETGRIRALTGNHDWIWIEGNHDPEPPEHLGGNVSSELAVGPLTFRHLPQPGPQPGEVAGHLHPAAKVRVRGRGLRRRCFVTDGARLILPSFGAYTGGLNVLDPSFAKLLPGAFDVWLIGQDRLYRVPSRKLS